MKLSSKRAAVAIAVALSIALVLFTFGCSSKSKLGGGNNDTRTVMKVGGYKVTADEYNYIYFNAKIDYDGNNDGFWSENPEMHQALKETVVDILRSYYAVKKLASELKISLNSDDYNEINAAVEETISFYGGEDGYYTALAAEHLTGDSFRDFYEQELLSSKLRSYYIDESSGFIVADDKTLEADLPLNFARATHILILNEPGDDVAENKKLAEEVWARAAAGEDFDSLILEYGEDNGLDTKNGYYFTHGQLISKFEDAAFALDVGEISGVVETVNGFHIIKRLPLEPGYIDLFFEELRTIYKNRIFNEKLEETAKSLDIEYTDVYTELYGE